MFNDYIEVGFDLCQFKINGYDYSAIIKEVNEDHLVVAPIQRTNWKDIHETSLSTKFDKLHLPRTSFDNIKLEIWMDGRGCDNSAIGISGCYEPYTRFLTKKEAA
tara:strand:- start:25 stop:339 length:315 start_codon:yes stop_codon:yes gene_type:complete